MTVEIVRLKDLAVDGLASLVAEAERDGWRFVRRLVEEWASGVTGFDGPGEALFAAVAGGRVVGVCGLTVDPYIASPRVGRVRRLYVAAMHRRAGVGRQLVGEVICSARSRFDVLRLRTNDPSAARFYTGLGFLPSVGEPDCTHVMDLRPAPDAEHPRVG
jgi:GNAT superfamily N-acetyltransferase